MAQEDYYSLLSVDREAPEREIKQAYYRLARELHPDKAKTPEEARTNNERLAVISKAYNTLKDPQKRTEYDASNKRAGSGSAPRPSPPLAPAAAPSTGGSTAPAPGGPPPTPAQKQASTGAAVGAAAGAKVSASDIASQKVLTAQKAFVKGMEFYKNQDFKKALPFFEAAVSNDPESEAHYHMKLAICLMRTKGSFSRAVEAAEKATQLDGYNVEFKMGLGEIYETVGASSKAVTVYEDVLKWEPENDRAKLRIRMLKSAESEKNPSMLAKIFPSLFNKKKK